MFVVFAALVFFAFVQTSGSTMLTIQDEEERQVEFIATPIICRLECEEAGV